MTLHSILAQIDTLEKERHLLNVRIENLRAEATRVRSVLDHEAPGLLAALDEITRMQSVGRIHTLAASLVAVFDPPNQEKP